MNWFDPGDQDFWIQLERLATQAEFHVTCPRATSDDFFTQVEHPVDYGYLIQSNTSPNPPLRVWVGSEPGSRLVGLLLEFDETRTGIGLNLLLGCSASEQHSILEFCQRRAIPATLIQREAALAWLGTRRSVRRFQTQSVPEYLLQQILESATQAPSAHNRQPWRFAVVQNAALRARLATAMGADFRRDLEADGLPAAEIEKRLQTSHQRITTAPAAILLCLDPTQGDIYPDARRQQAETLMGVQSVAMAGATLLLAAHAAGLGGVWLCAPLFAPESICQVLGLPPSWQPQGLVLLGYPANQPPARPRKPLDEVALFL